MINTSDRKIKKGDKFVCTKDVILEGTNTVIYKANHTYISDADDCITDELGDTLRTWRYEPWEDVNWPDYFIPAPHPVEKCDCDKCKAPDRDFFQSVQEEYNKPTGCLVKEEDGTITYRQFETGAVRDSNEGKSRPDLISPYFTERLGFRLAEGAKKYDENNWKKGIPDEAFLESLERHLVAYKMGKTDEDHAAAIAFNIMGIIHNQEVRKLEEKRP